MINVVVGGQMDKQQISKLIEKHGDGKVKVSVKEILKLYSILKMDKQTTILVLVQQVQEEL